MSKAISDAVLLRRVGTGPRSRRVAVHAADIQRERHQVTHSLRCPGSGASDRGGDTVMDLSRIISLTAFLL